MDNTTITDNGVLTKFKDYPSIVQTGGKVYCLVEREEYDKMLADIKALREELYNAVYEGEVGNADAVLNQTEHYACKEE